MKTESSSYGRSRAESDAADRRRQPNLQESNGGYTVSIPKEIAEPYGLDAGDQVFWIGSPDGEKPEFLPPDEI